MPFPLQLGALEEFCHPRESHVFARPTYHDGQALAGNGYMLLRVHKGLWMESDFEEPPAGFLTRFMAAPWDGASRNPENWQSMDEIKGDLFRFGVRGMWLGERCAPSPVWRLGASFLARQSHLQLIARLPRCEVFVVTGSALHFRFSGGMGILAQDKRLTEFSYSVFAPRYTYDGNLIEKRKAPRTDSGKPVALTGFFAPVPDPGVEDWPPAGAE